MRLLTDTVMGRLILVVTSPVWAALLCLFTLMSFVLVGVLTVVEYITWGPSTRDESYRDNISW